MEDLKGKVALITGASSGIGAATAIDFARRGTFVAINGRNKERLAKTEEECFKAGLEPDNVLVVAGDLTKEEDAADVVNKTMAHFGRLDILVNNHGIVKVSDILSAPISDYDEVMKTNLRSVLVMTKLCVPHLKQSRGNIVNVSSVSSMIGMPTVAAYCLTKSALDQLTKTLALQLAPDGIRVNSVNPGYVYSDIFLNAGMNHQEEQDLWKTAGPCHAMGRVGLAEEVARPICFLASDESSFITGVILLVDGGFALMRPK